MKQSSYLILSLIALIWSPLFLLQAPLATASFTTTELRNATRYARIGAIVDQTSRPGKEAKVAIEIAIHDFNIRTNWSSVFYFQNSRSRPVHAALAARELIDKHNVRAILGAHTWEEAYAIAEVISEADRHKNIDAFFSLADTTPQQVTEQWPFFVQAVHTQSTQMDAVAAILQSWGLPQVTLIYENSAFLSSSSTSIISHLSQAFRQTGAILSNVVPLTSFSCLGEELEVLKRQERKIFVIHTSLELGIPLFQTAKKMEMTGDGYLWIATNAITDLFHSINTTMISSLKGVLGVKTYFPENTPDFQDFRKRFRRKFQSEYPEEEQDEPGVFAVQAYHAVRLLSIHHWKLSPASTVEIVNVIGRSYHSGYWTKGLGFSETLDDGIHGVTVYSDSMDDLGQVLWPAQPWNAHRHRRSLAESSAGPMKVGVPRHSLFNQFVKVEFDSKENKYVFDGFVIAVFEEMMKRLDLPFEFTPFTGSYDELVEQIPAKKFDAIAGDVTIVSWRHDMADFTQPYTESGLEMIVPVRSKLSNRVWLFMKPFSLEMWGFIAAITIYNGFIVWLIERNHNADLQGSTLTTQIGIIFWLAFTTLFTLRGDKLHSNLSRMAMVVWLFVALIITQSYTASLASMLTAQRLEPAISGIETLKNMNATVGYCNGSFVNYYLKDVLDFKDVKIKSYNSTERYAEALNSGEIAAIFLEVPTAKLFLAQYCRSFIRTGETFKVGGFGFAFPKDYPRLSEVNKALMNVSESRKLKELEDRYIVSEKCVDEASSPDEDTSLGPNSFWVLFGLTGGTSTVALAIYVTITIGVIQDSDPTNTNVIKIILKFIKDWRHQRRRSSGVVVNAEEP